MKVLLSSAKVSRPDITRVTELLPDSYHYAVQTGILLFLGLSEAQGYTTYDDSGSHYKDDILLK